MTDLETRIRQNEGATDEKPEDYDGRGLTAAYLILLACLAVGIWLALMLRAEAHEAPTGWRFEPECCGNGDCKPVGQGEIRVTPDGYLIPATGEVIPFQSHKVRSSPDGKPYRCSVQGKREGNTYCIYISKGGF